MEAVTSGNLLKDFYYGLDWMLINAKKRPIVYLKVDDLMKQMLIQNGANVSNEAQMRKLVSDDNCNLRVVEIVNASGSENCPYYDYINFMGMNYLIIFPDELGQIKEASDDGSDEWIKNNYFVGLKIMNLVKMFMTLINPVSSNHLFKNTICYDMNEMMPWYIMVDLISKKAPVMETEDYEFIRDVSVIQEFLSKISFDHLLSGLII